MNHLQKQNNLIFRNKSYLRNLIKPFLNFINPVEQNALSYKCIRYYYYLILWTDFMTLFFYGLTLMRDASNPTADNNLHTSS